jgi:hypothetical protein
MIEIFDPRHGRVLKTVRYRWQARLICRFINTLDWWPADEPNPDV